MTSMTSPRGPLPARVYWIRRGIALLLALLLVFVIGKVLSSFGGNDGGGPAATTVAQHDPPTSTAGAAAGSALGNQASSTQIRPKHPKHPKQSKTPQPQSVPTGQCSDGDVRVTPRVTGVDGGGAIGIPLKLTTAGGACTWRVSSRSIVVKVTSGSDRIWSTQDCTGSIPTTDVVVRPDGEKAATVQVSWNGRRSLTDCPKGTGWAGPGYYHVVAASLGGSPTDVQFSVTAPPRPTVTKTAKPKPKHKPTAVQTPKG